MFVLVEWKTLLKILLTLYSQELLDAREEKLELNALILYTKVRQYLGTILKKITVFQLMFQVKMNLNRI